MDGILQENGSYLLKEDGEILLLESELFNQFNNYGGIRVEDGMSTGEKIK